MNLDGLILREATREDCNTLLTLEQQVIAAERPFNASIKDRDAYYYDIDQLVSDSASRLLVGEIDGSIIATGYVQLRQSKPALAHDTHGYLGFMYVAEAYRGRGLNRVILQDLVNWGRQQGVTDFYLDVYAENSSAVRAYEKVGFQPSLLEMKLDTEAL